MNQSEKKTDTYQGVPYPLFTIKPDEFEILVYDLIKQNNDNQIGLFGNIYENIDRLDKSGDRGRDILLTTGGNAKGVVQCKHTKDSSKKFTKSECLREIIKFVLNYQLDNSLIHNPEDFTYYFAVSTGFNEEAILFLNNFKKEVLKSPNLGQTIKSIHSEFQKLNLNLELNINSVQRILTKLTIKKINFEDINSWLHHKHNENIVIKNFPVKVMLVKGERTLVEKYSVNELLSNINAASFSLENYENNFYKLSDSHIERKETGDLHNWILAPLGIKEEPIVILEGKPGIGKSVVLRDLFDKLKNEEIPVVGIKSDQVYTTSKDSLEKELGLVSSFEEIIKIIVAKYKKLVIIIDQIDALSSSLTAQRKFLNTYKLLINQLKEISGVRIVVSIRSFDLQTDSDYLFIRECKSIKLSNLSKDQINTVLHKLKPDLKFNDDKLYELLSVPYNLNAFVKIFNEKLNINILKTTSDLYNELWLQKVIRSELRKQSPIGIQPFLYQIAHEMHESQTIQVSQGKYLSQYLKEIDFLQREGILVLNKSGIQFFHQTFYEFVFAKQFSESGESLIIFIKNNSQSLAIRSKVKMIVNFYRENDHNKYLESLNYIIFNRNIRFHLKLMLIQTLAAEIEPSQIEKQFVKNKLLIKRKYNHIFIESIKSIKWLKLIIDHGIINDLENSKPKYFDNWLESKVIKSRFERFIRKLGYIPFSERKERDSNIWKVLFLRLLPDARNEILDFVDNTSFSNKEEFLIRLLYYLKIWDNPLAIKFYEEVSDHIKGTRFDFFKIMEDAMKLNFDWALNQYKNLIEKRITELKVGALRSEIEFGHEDKELLDKFYNTDFLKTFHFNYEIVQTLVSKTKYDTPFEKEDFTQDHAFSLSSFNENHDYRYLYSKLGKETRTLGKKSPEIFEAFLSENLDTKFESIISIIIYGLIENGERYKDWVYKLLQILSQKNVLRKDYKWCYYVRILIGESYRHFNSSQRENVNQLILHLQYSPKNYHFHELPDGKKKVIFYFNKLKYKYLLAIPESEINKQTVLKKAFLECKRRFNDFKEKEPTGGVAHVVGPPLKNKAYSYMSLDAWEKSFLKYDGNEKTDFGSLKGSINEHANRFQDEVKKRPEYFAQFIDKLIEKKDIDLTYVIRGMWGLKDAKFDFEPFKQSFLKLLANRNIEEHDNVYVTWLVDYIMENDYMDDTIFEFLERNALYGETPNDTLNPDEPHMDGINSIRGAALERIIRLIYTPQYKERIFEIIESASKDPYESIKAVCLVDIAYLNHYDIERAFNIFKTLIKTESPSLLKFSFFSAGFYKKTYFEEMVPYFNELFKHDDLHENTAILLAVAWLQGVDKAMKILTDLISISEKARAKVIYVCEENLFSDETEVHEKCIQLFERFLKDKSKEVAQTYSHLFLRFKHDKFNEFYPQLIKYSKSQVAFNDPEYFLKYLFQNSGKYPTQCLDLMENMDMKHNPNKSEYSFENDSVLNIITGAYNAYMNDSNANKRQVKRTINLFDKYLKDSRFRLAAESVLQKSDLS